MRRFSEKLREGIDKLLDKIPRKTQVAINLLLIFIFPLLIYVFIGAPAFTVEHGYRRAEKENLVGPGQILGIEELDGIFADTLVVGETGEGVILYTTNTMNGERIDALVYWERRGELMLCGAPAFLSQLVPPNGDDLTLILFDNHPQAVRAEADIELFWEDNRTGQQYRYRYSLAGTRTNPGYIRMDYDVQWHDYSGLEDHPENTTIFQFSAKAKNDFYHAPAGEFPATVRLYDENGQLLVCEDIFIFPQKASPAGN